MNAHMLPLHRNRRAVFLDRDGVLNRAIVRNGKPHPPHSVDELEILPGTAAALDSLRQAGFLLIVVTNQPDVARGMQRRETVEAINGALESALPLDAVYTCYDDGDSTRKKPNPGMLEEAAADFGIDLAGSFLVGDRWKDVEAGRRAGCRTVFIDRQYAERAPWPPPDFATNSLWEAAAWILQASTESLQVVARAA